MRVLRLAMLPFLSLAVPATAQVPQTAIQRVANFPQREARDVLVEGRRFHIKPVNVTYSTGPVGRRFINVSGQISHVLRARADDQYHYRISITEGRLVGYSERINRGGFNSILNSVADEASRLPFIGGRAADSIRSFEQLVRPPSDRGGWEATARKIAAAVAIHVASYD